MLANELTNKRTSKGKKWVKRVYIHINCRLLAANKQKQAESMTSLVDITTLLCTVENWQGVHGTFMEVHLLNLLIKMRELHLKSQCLKELKQIFWILLFCLFLISLVFIGYYFYIEKEHVMIEICSAHDSSRAEQSMDENYCSFTDDFTSKRWPSIIQLYTDWHFSSYRRDWTECGEESWAASCLWCYGYK